MDGGVGGWVDRMGGWVDGWEVVLVGGWADTMGGWVGGWGGERGDEGVTRDTQDTYILLEILAIYIVLFGLGG